tara:strand:+ start:1132 stop:1662 length:531 start_codon:yes stop_codon:yes gene_type:complete
MSELLAMLTGGAPPMSGDMIRSTSKAKITPGDVAACMTAVDRHTYLYALAKFCLDTSGWNELKLHAIHEAREFNWSVRGDESHVVEHLAMVALHDSLAPAKCKKCKGTGVSENAQGCQNCAGTGNKKMTEYALSELLDVGRWRTKKIWMTRFKLLCSQYQLREDAINGAIHKGLRD